MDLERKIALLPPDLRDEAEHYIDYLLARAGTVPGESSGPAGSEENDAIPGFPETPQERLSPGVRGKTGSSGIILAEERELGSADPDYIDFADINSRFGNADEDQEKEEEKPRRSLTRRMLDWM